MSKTNAVKIAILVVILGGAIYFALAPTSSPPPGHRRQRRGFLRARCSFGIAGSEKLPRANRRAEPLGNVVSAVRGGDAQLGRVRGENAEPRRGCGQRQRRRGPQRSSGFHPEIPHFVPRRDAIRIAPSRLAMARSNSRKHTFSITRDCLRKRWSARRIGLTPACRISSSTSPTGRTRRMWLTVNEVRCKSQPHSCFVFPSRGPFVIFNRLRLWIRRKLRAPWRMKRDGP